MRCYGKNRARILGMFTEPQEEHARIRCTRCGVLKKIDRFDGGIYSTCDTCRSRDARYRERKTNDL